MSCWGGIQLYTPIKLTHSLLALLQVLNTKQRAELMVLCYPYMSILRTLLDTCASAEEPTFEQLTAITEPSFMQQEWHHFTEYIQTVTSKTFQQMNHNYLPFQH